MKVVAGMYSIMEFIRVSGVTPIHPRPELELIIGLTHGKRGELTHDLSQNELYGLPMVSGIKSAILPIAWHLCWVVTGSALVHLIDVFRTWNLF